MHLHFIYPDQPIIHLMNKSQLIETVQEILGKKTTKRTASDAVEAVLKALTIGVHHGKVQLIGFGTFKTIERKSRMGRNPKKPEELFEIKASKTVRFHASSTLKASL